MKNYLKTALLFVLLNLSKTSFAEPSSSCESTMNKVDALLQELSTVDFINRKVNAKAEKAFMLELWAAFVKNRSSLTGDKIGNDQILELTNEQKKISEVFIYAYWGLIFNKKLQKYPGMDKLTAEEKMNIATSPILYSAKTYDPRFVTKQGKSVQFSTYVFRILRREIVKSMAQYFGITQHTYKLLVDYRRTYNKLFKLNDRKPTKDEVRNSLNWTEETFSNIETISIRIAAGNRKNNKDDEVLKFHPAKVIIDYENDFAENNNVIQSFAGILTEKEFDILIRNSLKRETLDQIGKDYGLTKERVRQIRNTAIDKIRAKIKL